MAIAIFFIFHLVIFAPSRGFSNPPVKSGSFLNPVVLSDQSYELRGHTWIAVLGTVFFFILVLIFFAQKK
jgi:hypothetical protein